MTFFFFNLISGTWLSLRGFERRDFRVNETRKKDSEGGNMYNVNVYKVWNECLCLPVISMVNRLSVSNGRTTILVHRIYIYITFLPYWPQLFISINDVYIYTYSLILFDASITLRHVPSICLAISLCDANSPCPLSFHIAHTLFPSIPHHPTTLHSAFSQSLVDWTWPTALEKLAKIIEFLIKYSHSHWSLTHNIKFNYHMFIYIYSCFLFFKRPMIIKFT